MYEKLEKQPFRPFWDHLRRLLVRHSFSHSEMLGLSCHVIVCERGTPNASSVVRRNVGSCEPILLSIAHELSEHRVVPDVNGESSRQNDFTGGKEKI